MPKAAEEMAAALRVLELALEAAEAAPPGKRVRLEKLLPKAAERLGLPAEEAVRAAAVRAGTEPFMLDMWSEEPSRTLDDVKGVLRGAAAGMRRALQAGLSPDAVAELLAGDMERGLAWIPAGLLRSMHELGRGTNEVLRGERPAADLEGLAKAHLEACARWSAGLESRWGKAEADVLCPVRPEEVPF